MNSTRESCETNRGISETNLRETKTDVDLFYCSFITQLQNFPNIIQVTNIVIKPKSILKLPIGA